MKTTIIASFLILIVLSCCVPVEKEGKYKRGENICMLGHVTGQIIEIDNHESITDEKGKISYIPVYRVAIRTKNGELQFVTVREDLINITTCE